VLYLVYTIHVLVCIFLILVVLLQQGKGADLSVFGGGSTQTAFGAVGATSLLHKLTVGSFILFILTTMTIAVTQHNRQGGGTVLSESAALEEAQDAEAQDTATAESSPAETGPATSEAAAETGDQAGGSAEAPSMSPEAPEASAEGETEAPGSGDS